VIQLGGDASMHCEILVVDECTKRQFLEEIEYILIDLATILLLAFIKLVLHYNLKLKNVVIVLPS
jgi:hypothetical protein